MKSQIFTFVYLTKKKAVWRLILACRMPFLGDEFGGLKERLHESPRHSRFPLAVNLSI